MVLDTSAALDTVLDTAKGRTLRHFLLDPETALLAPANMWVEVGRFLRATAQEGKLTRAQAEGALADLLDLGVTEMQVEPLLPRAWQLRDNVTIDDGVFLALAETVGQPLLTTDARLARAARQRTGVAVYPA